MIKPGSIYLHYKKKLYNVIDNINLLNSSEEHVLYSNMYLPKRTWIRPKSMFLDNIENGEKRFTHITDYLNVGSLQDIEKYYQTLDNLGFNDDKENTINMYLDRNMQPDKIQIDNKINIFFKYCSILGYLKCIGKATHTENEETYFIFKKDAKLVGIKYSFCGAVGKGE